MSTKAIGWALEQAVGNAPAKLMLLGYAEHAGRESWVAWPSRETVAAYAEVEIRQGYRLHGYLLEHEFLASASLDDLTLEERERYLLIPVNRRPKLWRLTGGHLPSRDVTGDRAAGVSSGMSSGMSSDEGGVSSEASWDVTEAGSGVSSDDNRTVITEPSIEPGAGLRDARRRVAAGRSES